VFYISKTKYIEFCYKKFYFLADVSNLHPLKLIFFIYNRTNNTIGGIVLMNIKIGMIVAKTM